VWRDDVSFAGRISNKAFFPIWLVLKSMICVTWILYVTDDYRGRLSSIDSGLITATFVMLLVTEAFRKSWSWVAADWNHRRLALLNAIVLLGSAIATMVLLGLSSNAFNRSTSIVGLIFYGLYTMWLLVALYYTSMYVWLGQDMVRPTMQNPYIKLKRVKPLPRYRKV